MVRKRKFYRQAAKIPVWQSDAKQTRIHGSIDEAIITTWPAADLPMETVMMETVLQSSYQLHTLRPAPININPILPPLPKTAESGATFENDMSKIAAENGDNTVMGVE